jgi:hypothetical protein
MTQSELACRESERDKRNTEKMLMESQEGGQRVSRGVCQGFQNTFIAKSCKSSAGRIHNKVVRRPHGIKLLMGKVRTRRLTIYG